MGLDLFHNMVVAPELGEKFGYYMENVIEFPDSFKEKFKDRIFYRDVEYVDWEATVQKLFQMSLTDFYDKYENYGEMERNGETLYSFCTKDCENPFDDPNRFMIPLSQCEKVVQSDPHIIYKSLGGVRKCMSDGFYRAYDPNTIIIDKEEVKKMSRFCDGPDCMETFLESFLVNWCSDSYVEVNY